MIFFSLEILRRLVKTKVYYKLCYSVWKETSHQPWKVAAAKKSFQSVYIIDTTCFDECFLFHVTTGRHYFLYKFIVTWRFRKTAMLLFSLKQVFWKKSAFYIRYFHNKIKMLLFPKAHNKFSTSQIYLYCFFSTLSVCECSTFPL